MFYIVLNLTWHKCTGILVCYKLASNDNNYLIKIYIDSFIETLKAYASNDSNYLTKIY